MEYLVEHFNYVVSVLLMLMGLFTAITSANLVKKLIGIAVFQTSVLLFYISIAYVDGAYAPILKEGVTSYVNPLPHVLMLTAIVVGIAVLAVGLSIVVRIKEEYSTVEENEVIKSDFEYDREVQE